MPPTPLWTPSPERVAAARLTAFAHTLESRGYGPFSDYASLHRWSIDEPALFWGEVWKCCDIVHGGEIRSVLENARIPGARWFDGVELSFAENLLRHDDDRPAIIAECEDESRRREISHRELRQLVARARHGLEKLGVGPGDRVGALVPNIPEAVVVALATSSLGAIWSSCSPDFGAQGVLDRFGQIEPKVLLSADGYVYGGKSFSMRERLETILSSLPSVENVVVAPHYGPEIHGLRDQVAWDEFLGPEDAPLEFDRFPFDHPLYILYTSGTTGVPKCILHGQGGTLLKHAQEQVLQCDIGADDVFFYFTTCGWMMWNWLLSGLARGATIVLYDGNPVTPDALRLFRMAVRNRISIFGTSPRFLSVLEKAGVEPGKDCDLQSLRTVLSTGAPLNPAQFEWVYRAIKSDVHLASISGGTDLIGCFVGGAPTLPVCAGEIQCSALGMNVESVDENGDAHIGRKGELVCSTPFPSLPLGFWNDVDGAKCHRAYFERFAGRWHHGDFIEITERGSSIIHGRSDATLNPGGVRIGTAEIYRLVEKLPEIADSIAVAREIDGDVQIALFIVLSEDAELDDSLRQRIRRTVREGASPRHQPSGIHSVPEIPRTMSGKPVEMAVAKLLRGEEITNRDALANPEALDAFLPFANPPAEGPEIRE
jgi:acetoacetyl-CoA synthetase